MLKTEPKLEGDVYYPSEEVVAQANVQSWEEMAEFASKDLEGFWAERAEELEWFEKWDKVLDDSNKPFFKWFVGGKTNIVHNALDRHVKTWRKNKLALIWVSEDGKEERTFSYYSLNREVNRFANIIKAMGITKGERVTIYLPRIPEIVFAMLACAKIGAIHSVVFAGFSVDALKGRIDDSESKLVITADGSWINGKIFELKRTVDDAIKTCPSVENVIVVKRTGHEVPMEAARDHWYHDMLALPIANGKVPPRC
jgi:acetyl-CoA synthetase